MKDPFEGKGFEGQAQAKLPDPFEGKGFSEEGLGALQDPFAGKGFAQEPAVDDGTEVPWYYTVAGKAGSFASALLRNAPLVGGPRVEGEDTPVGKGVEGVVEGIKAAPTIAKQVAEGMKLQAATAVPEAPGAIQSAFPMWDPQEDLPEEARVTKEKLLQTPQAQEALQGVKKAQEELAKLAPENPIAQTLFNYTVGIEQSLPAVAVGVATKRPGLGLAAMYGQVAAQSYGDLLAQGVEPELATTLSQTSAAIEAGTELIPLDYLVKNIGSDGLKTLFRYTLLEGGQEASSGLLQALVDKATLHPELTVRDIVDRTIAEGVSGALQAPVVGGLGKLQYRAQEAMKRLPSKSVEVLKELGDRAIASVPSLREYVQRKEREKLHEQLAKDLGLWEEYKAATERKQAELRAKVDVGLETEITKEELDKAEKHPGNYFGLIPQVEIDELTQVGLKTPTGEVIDFNKLPEGRVTVASNLEKIEEFYNKHKDDYSLSPWKQEQLVSLIESTRLVQQKVTPQLQALAEKLGRKKPLVLIDSTMLPELKKSPAFKHLYEYVQNKPSVLGFAFTMQPFDFVFINTQRLGTKAEVPGGVEGTAMDVAVHELGHTESIETFRKLPKEDQTRLVKLWLQSRKKAGIAESPEELFTELAKNREMNLYAGRTAEQVRRDSAKYIKYLNKFSEWLANRFAETVRADGSLQPDADKFSKLMYKKWRKAYSSTPLRKDYDFRDFSKLLALNEELLQVHEEIKKRRMVLEGLQAEDAQVQKAATEIAKTLTDLQADEYTDAAEPGAPDIPEGMPKRVQDDLTKYHKFAKYGYTITQLAKINPHLQGLQRYVETVERKWWVDKMRWLTQADEILRDWVKLGTTRADALGRFLLDLTVLSEREGKRYFPQDMEYHELVRMWDLDQEQQALAMRVEQMFVDALDMMESVRMEEVRRVYKDDPVEQERQLAKVRQETNELRKKNYFPLARFGPHIVVVKALTPFHDEVTGKNVKVGDVTEVRMFENEREASEFHKRMNQRSDVIASKGYLPEEMQPFAAMPGQLLAYFEKELELTPEQREALKLLKIETSSANSFLKRMKERKVTRGWSQDAMRAFAQYFQSFSGHMARLRWKADMLEAIKDVREYGKRLGWYGGDSRKVDQIADFMQNHLNYIMDPGNEWASLRAFAFVFHLGLVPKSAVVNMTQVPMVAYPYLAARYGDAAAVSELVRQSGRVWYTVRNPKKLSQGEREMLEELKRLGIIDESMATEVAAIGEGQSLSTLMVSDRKGQMFVRDMAGKAAWMFQTVEKLNRRLVALAAYNLAKKRGAPQAVAVRKAYEAVADTQYEYAYWDRPRFMRGKSSTMFVFWMYMQKTLFQMTHDKSAARMWLLWLFVAGLGGLPLAEDLMDLFDFVVRKAKKWLGAGDPYFNIRLELRKLAAEIGMNPDLVMHGISRDVMGVDLSGSLSLGRVIPGVDPIFGQTGDFDARLLRAGEQTSGAVWTIPLGLIRAAASDDPDLLRRWGSALPAFGRNIAKSVKMAQEEGITLPDGAVLVEYDMRKPEGVIRTVLQAAGFNPTEGAEAKEKYYMTKEAVQYYEGLRRALMWRMAEAVRNGNKEMKKQTLEDIQRFNKNVPYWQMRISAQGIRQALRGRARKRRLEENFGVGTPRALAIQREVEEGFAK